ncbi:MAG: carbamoyltransferase, partial [Candidatus Lindowbacteria bacterium]|nr:carbamoyltransferase [Candidatus Lindowbacteria bacterium]
KEQHEFWRPTKFGGDVPSYWDLFKDREDFSYDEIYPMDDLLDTYMDTATMDKMKALRVATVSKLLGVPVEKIRTVTHEECHRYYSYWGSSIRGEGLALTAEGIGDYSNQTVSKFSEKGVTELANTKDNHIGHIYQYITLILGMKPAQHEYKVMGLAPYANSHEVAKSYKVFEDILKVDGLNIVFNKEPKDLYFHFRDALEGHRFDGVAGALQLWVENLLSEWVTNCVKESGLKTVVFSGGVAQNIKAAKVLTELDCVEDFFVCPAAGDTSLPVGAAYFVMWEHLNKEGASTDMLKPMDNIYLGPEFNEEQTEKILNEEGAPERYKVTRGYTPEDVASRLANGKVVARCCGRMEFGLRSLGNRSIMADPRSAEIVRKVNTAIKFRDFWMPFTPSILAHRADDYVVNPKKLRSPYMTMAFDSTPLAQKELIAGLHPADMTCRPQFLEEHRNPGYYAILKAFEEKTGVGGVMNTSFNLHGLPIALGPKEALHTMDNSELDSLILDGFIVDRDED